ncbi:hypothetical protein KUCAC02_032448 [Chaenocephalus aceratus]|nr:hypothetical protein KUCAC02_032448 [Chaenocephalus aceratus]
MCYLTPRVKVVLTFTVGIFLYVALVDTVWTPALRGPRGQSGPLLYVALVDSLDPCSFSTWPSWTPSGPLLYVALVDSLDPCSFSTWPSWTPSGPLLYVALVDTVWTPALRGPRGHRLDPCSTWPSWTPSGPLLYVALMDTVWTPALRGPRGHRLDPCSTWPSWTPSGPLLYVALMDTVWTPALRHLEVAGVDPGAGHSVHHAVHEALVLLQVGAPLLRQDDLCDLGADLDPDSQVLLQQLLQQSLHLHLLRHLSEEQTIQPHLESSSPGVSCLTPVCPGEDFSRGLSHVAGPGSAADLHSSLVILLRSTGNR